MFTRFSANLSPGKTMYVADYLSKLPNEHWQSISMTFSAQTSAKQVQEYLESKFDKRRKGKLLIIISHPSWTPFGTL
jgi:dynein heavy chain